MKKNKREDEFTPQQYMNFVWGQNCISQENPQDFIIKLDFPPCSIRFNYADAMFADYEEFYHNIADVQFFTNERPSLEEVEKILIDAWNFFVLEERRLEEDFDY